MRPGAHPRICGLHNSNAPTNGITQSPNIRLIHTHLFNLHAIPNMPTIIIHAQGFGVCFVPDTP